MRLETSDDEKTTELYITGVREKVALIVALRPPLPPLVVWSMSASFLWMETECSTRGKLAFFVFFTCAALEPILSDSRLTDVFCSNNILQKCNGVLLANMSASVSLLLTTVGRNVK